MIIIIIGSVAAYVLTGGFGGGGNPAVSPTPTATATSVVGAANLQFFLNETSTNGALLTYEFYAKNVNSSNLMLRVNLPNPSANYSFIMDNSTQKSYVSTDNGATWQNSDFTADWSHLGEVFNEGVNQLVHWNGKDQTVTFTASNGATDIIYNITVDPTLPDSLFAH